MGARQSRPASLGMDEAADALTRWWARETRNGGCDPAPLSSRRASVLVPLSRGPDGGVQVLLCTRASGLSTHAGEVCLPGGKNDDGEGDVDAALREASEEVGLSPGDANVLASLPPFLSKGHVSVRPVVAAIPDEFEPVPNPEEVDRCFWVPLESFLTKEGYSFRDWEFTRGKRIRVHRFERGGHDVWGLTAVMLVRVAEIVYGRQAEFAMSPPGPGRDGHSEHRVRGAPECEHGTPAEHDVSQRRARQGHRRDSVVVVYANQSARVNQRVVWCIKMQSAQTR